MVRVALLTNEFPPTVGGIGRYYYNLVARYPGDITVWAPFSLDSELSDERLGKPVVRHRWLTTGALRQKLMWVRVAILLSRELHANRYSLVLCGNLFPFGIVAGLIKAITGIPYVLVVHGKDLAQTSGLRRLLLYLITSSAAGVVANSHYTMDMVASHGFPQCKGCIVFPGVDSGRFRPDVRTPVTRASLGLEGRPVLLSVGRLVERKGHDQVIRSLPLVVKHFADLVYLVAGTGPHLEPLQELARSLKIEGNVQFLGEVNDDWLPGLYGSADLFIMPSRQIKGDVEGFGIVFLEANSCEKPVIAGASGGISDAVVDGATGLIVPPEDPEAIAEAIVRLLQNPTLAHKLGCQGRQRVLNLFQWEESARRLSEYLAKCSSTRRTRLD